jgi:hypothetical protein
MAGAYSSGRSRRYGRTVTNLTIVRGNPIPRKIRLAPLSEPALTSWIGA